MYGYFTDLDFRWATQGGLKMLSIRLDSIKSTQIVSPVVNSSCRSRFARRDSVQIESRRNMQIESNRKLPWTSQLSLGILDMDGLCEILIMSCMLTVEYVIQFFACVLSAVFKLPG